MKIFEAGVANAGFHERLGEAGKIAVIGAR
jgi:hypothetical protein